MISIFHDGNIMMDDGDKMKPEDWLNQAFFITACVMMLSMAVTLLIIFL